MPLPKPNPRLRGMYDEIDWPIVSGAGLPTPKEDREMTEPRTTIRPANDNPPKVK